MMNEITDWHPDSKTMAWWKGLTMMTHGGDEKYYYDYFRHHHRTRRQNAVRFRRDYRTLSDEERQRFHRAVQQLKSSERYDVFVRFHHPSRSPQAHFGPAFLGYHRELLLRYIGLHNRLWCSHVYDIYMICKHETDPC